MDFHFLIFFVLAKEMTASLLHLILCQNTQLLTIINHRVLLPFVAFSVHMSLLLHWWHTVWGMLLRPTVGGSTTHRTDAAGTRGQRTGYRTQRERRNRPLHTGTLPPCNHTEPGAPSTAGAGVYRSMPGQVYLSELGYTRLHRGKSGQTRAYRWHTGATECIAYDS